jgi:hypothetical protein
LTALLEKEREEAARKREAALEALRAQEAEERRKREAEAKRKAEEVIYAATPLNFVLVTSTLHST